MYRERLQRDAERERQQAQRMAWAAEIGAMVREQREFNLMKQYQLAQSTGIDQGSISLFETGHADLSIGRVKALLNAVGLDLAIVDFNAS